MQKAWQKDFNRIYKSFILQVDILSELLGYDIILN